MKDRDAMPGLDSRGPALGWIRTMREARGLSLRALGAKLGVQGNSIHVAERREASGGISLYQLQRIATALDCDLFYAFVPKRGTTRRSKPVVASEIERREALRRAKAKATHMAPTTPPGGDVVEDGTWSK